MLVSNRSPKSRIFCQVLELFLRKKMGNSGGGSGGGRNTPQTCSNGVHKECFNSGYDHGTNYGVKNVRLPDVCHVTEQTKTCFMDGLMQGASNRENKRSNICDGNDHCDYDSHTSDNQDDGHND